MSNINDKPIKFTKHARERLEEFGKDFKYAVWAIHNGTIEKQDHTQRKHKKNKYTDQAVHIREGTMIFSGIHKDDGVTGEPIFLVLTCYDQLMDLGPWAVV